MTDLSRFDGKIAVITGAAQGIGEATARLMAARGATGLLLTDRQPDKLDAVAQSLRGICAVETIVAELADAQQVQRIVSAADAAFGRVDVLANVAGTSSRGSIFETDLAEWDRVFAANVRAPFILMQDALRIMQRERIEGAIVNVLSINIYGGTPFLTAYSSSKGALAVLTKNAAHSVSRLRIRVNGINLGWTDTPGEHAIQGGKGSDWLSEAEAKRPFGRLLKPEDVARMVAFLASGESGLMTGALVDFDQLVIGANGPPGPRGKVADIGG